jgi:hypothetical protein
MIAISSASASDRNHRHLVQTRKLRRPPPALAGDDLVSILPTAHRPHHDRLDHAMLLDRVG